MNAIPPDGNIVRHASQARIERESVPLSAEGHESVLNPTPTYVVVLMDPAGDGMAIRVVDSPEVDLETFRMPLEQYHGLFDEVGGVKFPIVLQVKDVLAVHSRVGVVDRSDLTDSFARADEIVRAWKRVSEKNVQHGRPISTTMNCDTG